MNWIELIVPKLRLVVDVNTKTNELKSFRADWNWFHRRFQMNDRNYSAIFSWLTEKKSFRNWSENRWNNRRWLAGWGEVPIVIGTGLKRPVLINIIEIWFLIGSVTVGMEMYLAASPPLFSYLSMDPLASSPPSMASQQASSNAYRRRPTSFYRSSSTSINQLAVGINNIDFTSFSLPPPLQLPVASDLKSEFEIVSLILICFVWLMQLQRSSSVRMQLPIRSASVPDISVYARRNLSLSSANNASSVDLTRRNGLSVAGLTSTSDLTGHSVITLLQWILIQYWFNIMRYYEILMIYWWYIDGMGQARAVDGVDVHPPSHLVD